MKRLLTTLLVAIFILSINLPINAQESDGNNEFDRIYTENIPAIVLINIYNRDDQRIALGSGFIINHEGYIVTNYHVISGAWRVEVVLEENDQRYDVQTYTVHRNIDLALLKINADNLPTVHMGSKNRISVNDPVQIVGYPGGVMLARTLGKIKSIEENHFQTNAPVAPGSSGGPVFNSMGEVIGIVVSGFRQRITNRAIAIDVARDFFNQTVNNKDLWQTLPPDFMRLTENQLFRRIQGVYNNDERMETIELGNNFLQLYLNSERANRVMIMMASSYLTNGNYELSAYLYEMAFETNANLPANTDSRLKNSKLIPYYYNCELSYYMIMTKNCQKVEEYFGKIPAGHNLYWKALKIKWLCLYYADSDCAAIRVFNQLYHYSGLHFDCDDFQKVINSYTYCKSTEDNNDINFQDVNNYLEYMQDICVSCNWVTNWANVKEEENKRNGKEDYHEIIEQMSHYEANCNNDFNYCFSYGRFLYLFGNYTDARRWLNKALSLNQNNKKARDYYNLASIALADALFHLDTPNLGTIKLIENQLIKPYSLSVLVQLGLYYYNNRSILDGQQGSNEGNACRKAKQIFTKVVGLERDLCRYWYYLALTNKCLEDWPQVLVVTEQGLDCNNCKSHYQIKLHLLKAEVLLKNNECSLAINELEIALNIINNNGGQNNTNYNKYNRIRAKVMIDCDDGEKNNCDRYERAIQIDPENINSYRRLATCYYNQQRYQDAIDTMMSLEAILKTTTRFNIDAVYMSSFNCSLARYYLARGQQLDQQGAGETLKNFQNAYARIQQISTTEDGNTCHCGCDCIQKKDVYRALILYLWKTVDENATDVTVDMLKSAEDYCNEAITCFSNDCDFYYYYGLIYKKKGDICSMHNINNNRTLERQQYYETALEYFQNAIQKCPKFCNALHAIVRIGNILNREELRREGERGLHEANCP